MKYLILGLGLLLVGCAHPNTPPPPQAEPIGADTLTSAYSLASQPIELKLHAADSGYTPQQVVRRRLFGLLPPKAAPTPTVASVPRKCKGCTFNLVAGNQTNTTAAKKSTVAAGDGASATTVAKASAPVATSSGDATDNTKAGQRGGAAATAPNATATATTEKAGFPWWVLSIPVVVYVGYRKLIAV